MNDQAKMAWDAVVAKDRLAAQSSASGDCRLWDGATNSRTGAGKLIVNGTIYVAHRLSYVAHVGPIPDNAVIRQTCGNKRCIRPEHLTVASLSDVRRETGRQSFCRNGHEMSGYNLVIHKHGTSPPTHACRACRNARERTSDR